MSNGRIARCNSENYSCQRYPAFIVYWTHTVNLIVNTPGQLGEILSSTRQAKGLRQAEAATRIGVG